MKFIFKLLTIWAFVINTAFGQGDPAPFIKGMGSTGLGNSASTILVPNNQSTKINAYQALIETGNSNLLVNSGFEHSTPTTGWTLTNATAAVNTTNKLEGAKALQVTPTIAGGGIKQVVTLNASNLLGSQGVIEVPVRTSGTDVKVCFLANNVRTYCKDVPAYDTSSTFKTIVTPITFDGTSNGIEVYSTGISVFIIDEIKIGRGLPLQNVNGAKLVGTVKYAPTALCEWIAVSPTSAFANFPVDNDCPTPTVSGQLKAAATKLPAFILPSGSPAGTYKIYANGMFYNNSSNYNALRLSDGTNFTNGGVNYLSNSGGFSINGEFTYSASVSSDLTIQVQARTDTGNSNITATTLTDGLTFAVYYFPPESKIYSQASQDYDWTSYTPTFTGFGTVTNTNCIHKREGSDLLLNCYFTAGTTTATEFRVSLPSSLAALSSLPTISIAGQMKAFSTNANNSGLNVLKEPGVGYVTFGVESTGNAGLSKTSSTAQIVTGVTYSFDARIPIQGWSDYGVIVGSFAGIEKCANDYECTDTFSAHVDTTGIVTGENIDWINGNCSIGASSTTCTYNTNLKDGLTSLSNRMNCVATLQNLNVSAQNNVFAISANSSTGFTFIASQPGVGNSPREFDVKCQKSGNDYKPKTAKVATSVDVVTSPSGSLQIKPVSFGAHVNSTGTITLKTGGFILGSCSTASNVQTCNLNITLSQKATCQCNIAEPPSAANLICNYDISNSTTSLVKFWTTANAIASARDLVFHCDGVQP